MNVIGIYLMFEESQLEPYEELGKLHGIAETREDAIDWLTNHYGHNEPPTPKGMHRKGFELFGVKVLAGEITHGIIELPVYRKGTP